MVVTALNGTMCTAPSPARSRMVRIETFSTVPDSPDTVTMSPTCTVFSSSRNSPVMRSCTSFCEPKPIAMPTMPAPASSGATLTPISLSAVSPTTVDDHAQQHRAQHRLEGAQPRRAGVMALARQHVELAVHQRIADLPDHGRRERGDADRHHRREQPAADLAAIEPDDGIDAPHFEQRDKADHGDHAEHDLAQQRQIAVGAGFEAREALQDVRPDAEAAVDQAQHHDDDEPRRPAATATVPTKYCSSSE